MSFTPVYNIARVDLIAHELPNGKLRVDTGRTGTFIYWDEWPETIMVNGVELGFEDVERNEDLMGDDNLIGDPTIVWGIYL